MPPPSSHYLLRRRLHNGTARFWRQRATWTNIPTMSSGGAPPTRPANAQVDPRRAHLVRVLHRAAAMRPAASTVKGEGGLEKGTSWCRRDNPMGGGQKRTQVYAAQTHNQVTVITADMLTLCALTDRGKDPYATAYGRRRGISTTPRSTPNQVQFGACRRPVCGPSIYPGALAEGGEDGRRGLGDASAGAAGTPGLG